MRAMLVGLVTLCCAPLWGEARFKDPHAFKDAAAMYRTVLEKPFDGAAAALIKTIDAGLKRRLSLEDDRIWNSILELNPYRKAPEVQAAIEQWATLHAAQVRPLLTSIGPVDVFDQANSDYRAGKFEDASAAYRKVLMKGAGHYNARNNLALAEMRRGADLAAEVELLTLRKLNEPYLPAAVNLTVVYERLGMGEKARELAAWAAEAGKEVPEAVFNAAWYKDAAGARTAALEMLAPLAEKETAPASTKSFIDLIEKAMGKPPNFWNVGLAGRAGAYGSVIGMVLAILVFVVVSLIVMGIAAGTSQRTKPGFWTFATFIFLYLVSWGVPASGWWLMMGLYVIVFLSMARGASNA